MWSQNIWVNAFGIGAYLYVAVMVLFAMPFLLESIKDGLMGKPFKTLRDLRFNQEEVEYLRIVSANRANRRERMVVVPNEVRPRCSQCGRPYSKKPGDFFERWYG